MKIPERAPAGEAESRVRRGPAGTASKLGAVFAKGPARLPLLGQVQAAHHAVGGAGRGRLGVRQADAQPESQGHCHTFRGRREVHLHIH